MDIIIVVTILGCAYMIDTSVGKVAKELREHNTREEIRDIRKYYNEQNLPNQ